MKGHKITFIKEGFIFKTEFIIIFANDLKDAISKFENTTITTGSGISAIKSRYTQNSITKIEVE